MDSFPDRTSRPKLALPYTVMSEPDTVRLVAGEDHRYTLNGAGLESWLPELLAGCDGRRSLEELIVGLDAPAQALARDVFERLYGERVLVNGPVELAHRPSAFALRIEGTGPLAECLVARAGIIARAEPTTARPLPVFCQDRLDYEAALAFNRHSLRAGITWIWATLGPLSRGYVSPPFVSGAGPCLACLLGHFQRLSPAPRFYDALIDHARGGHPIEPSPFPATGVEILVQLVLWKVEQLGRSHAPSSLYRLHVLELETMEVTSHRVLVDPGCPECGDGETDGGPLG